LTERPSDLDLRSQLQHAVRRIHELEQDLVKEKELHAATRETIQAIYASSSWKLLHRYTRIRDRLLPERSLRRRLFETLVKAPLNWCQTLTRPAHKVELRSVEVDYPRWMEQNEPGQADLEKQRQTRFPYEPRISLVVHIGSNTTFLRDLLHSVLAQTYSRWELCLDGGPKRTANRKTLLTEVGEADARIRVIAGPLVEETTGDFLAFLGPEDTLAPFALFEVVQTLNRYPDADCLYSDEDCLRRADGRRYAPHFKPDWSPDTLRSHNYIGHFLILQRGLLSRAELWQTRTEDGPYDLVLRATEHAARIVHVPRVLYHQRESAAGEPESAASRQALAAHLQRQGIQGDLRDGLRPHTFQVIYPLPAQPLVSILIPNRDQPDMLARCVESVRRSSYSNYEIILVENSSRRPETFALYDRLSREPNLRILVWKEPFNYAAVNNHAARRANGEVLLFLNNDVQAINTDWLEQLLQHALRPEIGAVGAKLYYPDNTIQHAGVVIGSRHGPMHYHCGFLRDSAGYKNRLVIVQNLSAVTGACLMTRKAVFEQVGGFDSEFAIAFNDIDLCLKMRREGYRIVWTPFAQLYHFEFTTRGHDDTPQKQSRNLFEHTLFRWKWAGIYERGDAYYNPNLTRDRLDCSLQV
jgi:GT2 family glycosyltransferase